MSQAAIVGRTNVRRDGDLRIVAVTKEFGAFTAVDALTLTIAQGSFFALLGPSGCGKTTTLRMVAGLEDPTMGQIFIGEADITAAKPYRRPVNTVFQSYALFPHLDVFENVAFGLRRRRQGEVKKQVLEALELVELGHLARRKPAQLSGGQQQRVALARAVVNRPSVLLLDEPLGALDLKLRRQMQIELKRIQTEVGITFVHVTHDQEEAMTMADTIAVMNAGRVEQMGAPGALYENPATTFAANFLGQSNLIRANVRGSSGEDLLLEVYGQRIAVPRARTSVSSSALHELLVGIRPEKIRASAAGSDHGAGVNVLTGGVVSDTSFTGVSSQYLVRMPWDQEVMVFAQNVGTEVLRPGTTVDLSWVPAHTFGLDPAQDAHAGEQIEGEEPAAAASGAPAAALGAVAAHP